MADRFSRHLSGWRIAALLPVAALVLAALLAACAPEEEPQPSTPAPDAMDDAASVNDDAAPEQDDAALSEQDDAAFLENASESLQQEYGSFLERVRAGWDPLRIRPIWRSDELVDLARQDPDISNEEYYDLFWRYGGRTPADAALSDQDYELLLDLARTGKNLEETPEYGALLARARQDPNLSDEEYYDRFWRDGRRTPVAADAEPEPGPPVLLNAPPAPIHTGGAPYPHGTFPPEAAPIWENVTEDLAQGGAVWGVTNACRDYNSYGVVLNQWLFVYQDELEDPEAAITADLRAAGLEFDSITVRTREYYDERYDPETFLNWLSTDNSRFDQYAALERLGGVVNPDAASTPFSEFRFTLFDHTTRSGQFRYQVKIHGADPFRESVDVDEIPNAYRISFSDNCHKLGALKSSGRLLQWMVGGLFTTFGDDVRLTRLVNDDRPIPDPIVCRLGSSLIADECPPDLTPSFPDFILTLVTPTTSTLD